MGGKPEITCCFFLFFSFGTGLKFILRSIKKILRHIKKRKNKKEKKSSAEQSETTEFMIFMHSFAINLQSAQKMWGRICY